MLDPAAPQPDECSAAVLAALGPVVTKDGQTFVELGKLREMLESAIAELRALPEQDAEVERAVDEGFAAIGDEIDRITAPKPLQ